MANLDWSQCPAVESVPGRLGGAWVFKDTRMPVSAVFENLRAGSDIEEIIEQFHVTREQIQAVLDFAVGTTNGSTQTVVPGGTATYTVNTAPTQGTTLPAVATLTVTGLPTGATATLTAASWTQLTGTSWQLPANTTMGNVLLTVVTQAQTASARGPDMPIRKMPPLLWGVLLLPFARRLRRAGKRMSRTISMVLLLTAGMAAVLVLGARRELRPESESDGLSVVSRGREPPPVLVGSVAV